MYISNFYFVSNVKYQCVVSNLVGNVMLFFNVFWLMYYLCDVGIFDIFKLEKLLIFKLII